MSAHPIPCVYVKGVFAPLKRATNLAAEHYGEGEVVTLAPVEGRSQASHNHFFAVLHDAWLNLPEPLAERFPTEDSLRKHALCKTGFCDVATHVEPSKEAATRLAAFLRAQGAGDIVVSDGATVTVLTAQSQSMRAMGKQRFQESKDAVIGVLAEMIGVHPESLPSNTPRAA